MLARHYQSDCCLRAGGSKYIMNNINIASLLSSPSSVAQVEHYNWLTNENRARGVSLCSVSLRSKKCCIIIFKTKKDSIILKCCLFKYELNSSINILQDIYQSPIEKHKFWKNPTQYLLQLQIHLQYVRLELF